MSPVESTDAAEIWLAYNAAENSRDFEAMGALMRADLAVSVNGRSAVSSAEDDLRAMSLLTSTYPDYRREVDGVVAAGDQATIRWRMRGTAAKPDLVADLDVPGCSVIECAGGVIETAHLYYDGQALDRVLSQAQEATDE